MAKIKKRVSPHRLRHTSTTHLVKTGTKLTVIRDLLGHLCLSSTQIYLHTTAEDLRGAAAKHPVERLIGRVEKLLPNVKLPFQWQPGENVIGAG
ncbi:MAG: tyrosine-type recombinase/integrase [Myxococcales bacterium]|nr:tyrosine-type recombinase/integrase [Myxococcales bacterium]